MRTVIVSILLFLQNPKCSQLSNKEQNTFQLIIGDERKDGMSMCPITFFHKCSFSNTCNYVIKVKKTSKCKEIQDLKHFENIAEDSLVWEKIPKTHRMYKHSGFLFNRHVRYMLEKLNCGI